jgi:hypothetical protein
MSQLDETLQAQAGGDAASDQLVEQAYMLVNTGTLRHNRGSTGGAVPNTTYVSMGPDLGDVADDYDGGYGVIRNTGTLTVAGSTKHAALSKDDGLFDTAAEGLGYMHINPSGAYDYAAGASASQGAVDYALASESGEGMYATIEPALPDDE